MRQLNRTSLGRFQLLMLLVFVPTLLFFISGCGGGNQIRSSKQVTNYDWESRPLHPEYAVYHQSNDSSTIWIKVHSSELLYARTSPDAPFEGRVACQVRIQEATDLGYQDIDSLNFSVVDENPDKTGRFVVAQEVFPLDTSGDFRFLIEVTDLNRRWEEQGQLLVQKSQNSGREDFLIRKNGLSVPVFGNDIQLGDTLHLETRRGPKLLRHFHWDPDLKLPPPPYAEARIGLPEPMGSPGESMIVGGLPIIAESGLLSVTDNNGLHLFTLRVHQNPFPQVESIQGMIESLRYISSRREFELMEGSKFPKQELDKFWLDCGGNKDRARELIRIYYNRVLEANYYFSSITEGWKTDRGLIHIIFGNPNRIRSTVDYETWIYGEEANVSSLVFNFRKMPTPFSRNHYQLERNPLYRTEWDRAVTAWRNGRIFQE